MPEPKRLRRDKKNGVLGGVCAGLAEFFDLDITVVRVIYVLLTIFTAFAGVLVYIILWIVIPAKEEAPVVSAPVAPPPMP